MNQKTRKIIYQLLMLLLLISSSTTMIYRILQNPTIKNTFNPFSSNQSAL